MKNYETEFISVVAHDLKAPLVAVRGFLDLLEASGGLNEQQAHFMGRAGMALDRMESLIKSLLEFARLQSDNVDLVFEPVDLRMLVKDSIMMMEGTAQQRNITLEAEFSENVIVPGDRELMRQVFNNLLTNAIKYNRDDGTVWIRVIEQQNVMRVDVQDTGIGIPVNEVPKVFDKFFRSSQLPREARRDGSGLGLSICQAVIQLHGGQIWVESKVNEGSTFSFTLPMGQNKSVSRQGFLTGESASEELDGLDDDTQEARDASVSESSHDAP